MSVDPRVMVRYPLDRRKYKQHRDSRPIRVGLNDGCYVYVRSVEGTIFVLPDGVHRHPRVLGGGKPASNAGDLTIQEGHIKDLTNLSGTFQFDEPEGLLTVAEQLKSIGFAFGPESICYFPMDGSSPVVLEFEGT